MLSLERKYQTPIVESLLDLQRIEHEFSVKAGFDLRKEDLMRAFNEEVLELQVEIKQEEVNPLTMASEIADIILMLLGIANFYEIDLENSLLKEEKLATSNFNFRQYTKNQPAEKTDCLTRAQIVLGCLAAERVEQKILGEKIIGLFKDLLSLANFYNLHLVNVISKKLNRNFHKYALFRQKTEQGLGFNEARQAVRKSWDKGEDNKFLQ